MKIAVPAVIALVLLWSGTLEPLVPKLNDLMNLTNKEDRAKHRVTTYLKRWERPTEDNPVLAALRTSSSIASADRRRQAAEAKIAFSLPGTGAFEVTTRMAGVVWCLLLAGLVAYLYSNRLKILSYVADAARLQLRAASAGQPPPSDALVVLPWWTAPMPNRDGTGLTSAQLRLFVMEQPSSRIPIALLLGSLVCLEVRVAVISIAALSAFDEAGKVHWLSILLIAVCVAVSLVTILICASWIFAAKPVPTRSLLGGGAVATDMRRLVLKAIPLVSAIVVFSAIAATRSPRMLTWIIRSPRWRRKKRPDPIKTSLAPGFYLNRRSKIVHYVDEIGMMVGLRLPRARRPRESNFSPITVANLPPAGGRHALPRFDHAVASHALQSAAASKRRNGDREGALELLEYQIALDLRRLAYGGKDVADKACYYRFVKSAILSGKDDRVSRLVEKIDAMSLRAHFRTEIASWTRKDSRWRRRMPYVHAKLRVDIPR